MDQNLKRITMKEGSLCSFDWEYISEGGKHAIFAYCPRGQPDDFFQGKVLRIDKDGFKSKGEKSDSQPSRSKLHRDAFRKLFSNDDKFCQQASTYMNAHRYLDSPFDIQLDRSFLYELRSTTIRNCKIPVSRQLDWNNNVMSPCTNQSSTVACTLLPNYRASNALSVEIKPKAGYLPTSPLVHPNHSAKYHVSRFQILQQLNHDGVMSKGWNRGSTLKEKSVYDPLDLFACNHDRIKKAITALFLCPQNNLKVHYGDRVLHSQETVDKSSGPLCTEGDKSYVDTCDLILETFFGKKRQHRQNNDDFGLKEMLIDVVSKILQQDPFLEHLLRLQKRYDILDADGAILVYNRLVTLCGGCNEEAEARIESLLYSLHEGDGSRVEKFLGIGDQPCINSEDSFSALMEFLRIGGSALFVKREILYKQGESLVENLSSDSCILLLYNWLQSLVLCDVSFFVIIKETNEGSKHIKLQNGKFLSYEIKVVDYDAKPAKKLRNRAKQESKFAQYVETTS